MLLSELIYQLQLQMQYLIQSKEILMPNYSSVKIENQSYSDFVSNHLQLQMIEKEKRANEAAIKVEKAALIPEITVGYYSMTMQGMGADDVLYGSGTRFQSFQLNLGIPIFNLEDNDFITPRFLFKVANLAIAANKKDEALGYLKTIKEKYESSQEGNNIDALIATLEQ